MTTLNIINGVNEIRTAIAAMSGKSAEYKALASNTLLSAVQHFRQHNDYTLVQEALDAMYALNYRDYAVYVKFINDMTHIGMTSESKGRRTHYTVIGTLKDAAVKPDDMTAKDWAEKLKRVASNVITRTGMFDSFAQGKATNVRNPDWKEGDKKDTKQVAVDYKGNIFAWFDDVSYLRNGSGDDKPTVKTPVEMTDTQAIALAASVADKLESSTNLPMGLVLRTLFERMESNKDLIVSDDDIEYIHAAADMLQRLSNTRRELKQQAATDTANAVQEAQAQAEATEEQVEA